MEYQVKAEVERTEKGLRAVASSGVVDRHGEIVEASGWDLKNFKKNPVMLWAHDHTIPAIGSAKNIKIDGVGKKAQLTFEPVLHEETPFAAAIKKLFDTGVLNSFSVGFRPIDVDGVTYTKQELLEISAVNVPANPEARMMAYKSLKGFGTEVIKDVVGEVPEDEEELINAQAEIEELKGQVSDLTEKYEDVVKGLKFLNPQRSNKEVAKSRLALSKVIARATDKALEQKQESAVSALKVIKRANERLTVDLKNEVKNG